MKEALCPKCGKWGSVYQYNKELFGSFWCWTNGKCTSCEWGVEEDEEVILRDVSLSDFSWKYIITN